MKKSPGFTSTESMIVIIVLGLILGVIYASWPKKSVEKELIVAEKTAPDVIAIPAVLDSLPLPATEVVPRYVYILTCFNNGTRIFSGSIHQDEGDNTIYNHTTGNSIQIIGDGSVCVWEFVEEIKREVSK